jgi:hypothetical protein
MYKLLDLNEFFAKRTSKTIVESNIRKLLSTKTLNERMNALQKNIRPTCEEVLLEKKFLS